MATGRIVVTPMLAIQCRTAMDAVPTAKQLPPLGEDPVWDILSSHMYRAWGKVSSAYAVNMA